MTLIFIVHKNRYIYTTYEGKKLIDMSSYRRHYESRKVKILIESDPIDSFLILNE